MCPVRVYASSWSLRRHSCTRHSALPPTARHIIGPKVSGIFFFALDVFLLRDILNSPAKVVLRLAYPGSCRREYEIGSYLCPYAVYIFAIEQTVGSGRRRPSPIIYTQAGVEMQLRTAHTPPSETDSTFGVL